MLTLLVNRVLLPVLGEIRAPHDFVLIIFFFSIFVCIFEIRIRNKNTAQWCLEQFNRFDN